MVVSLVVVVMSLVLMVVSLVVVVVSLVLVVVSLVLVSCMFVVVVGVCVFRTAAGYICQCQQCQTVFFHFSVFELSKNCQVYVKKSVRGLVYVRTR